MLKEAAELSPRDVLVYTELGIVYKEQKKYSEAEQVLKEAAVLNSKNVNAKTELAWVYVQTGRYRRARQVIVETVNSSKGKIIMGEHVFLPYLNATYRMRRCEEGVIFADQYDKKLQSPQLAEEYGRLLRSYDQNRAVEFFNTSVIKFAKNARLLSEAAICIKQTDEQVALSYLKRAISLNPSRAERYQFFYNQAYICLNYNLILKDHVGQIVEFDTTSRKGLVIAEGRYYSFHKLKAELDVANGRNIYFDVNSQGYAVNIEPHFLLDDLLID